MTTIKLSLRNDGHVDVDLTDDENDWNFNTLTIEEAKFLHEELGEILLRASKRFPNGTPEDDEEDPLLEAAREAVKGEWWDERPQMDALAAAVANIEEAE